MRKFSFKAFALFGVGGILLLSTAAALALPRLPGHTCFDRSYQTYSTSSGESTTTLHRVFECIPNGGSGPADPPPPREGGNVPTGPGGGGDNNLITSKMGCAQLKDQRFFLQAEQLEAEVRRAEAFREFDSLSATLQTALQNEAAVNGAYQIANSRCLTATRSFNNAAAQLRGECRFSPKTEASVACIDRAEQSPSLEPLAANRDQLCQIRDEAYVSYDALRDTKLAFGNAIYAEAGKVQAEDANIAQMQAEINKINRLLKSKNCK